MGCRSRIISYDEKLYLSLLNARDSLRNQKKLL